MRHRCTCASVQTCDPPQPLPLVQMEIPRGFGRLRGGVAALHVFLATFCSNNGFLFAPTGRTPAIINPAAIPIIARWLASQTHYTTDSIWQLPTNAACGRSPSSSPTIFRTHAGKARLWINFCEVPCTAFKSKVQTFV